MKLQMKKVVLLLFALLFTAFTFAQKKEKIKGSKVVTVTQKAVENFENLEVEDNIEIFLIKGSTQSLEIEADDNLHETEINTRKKPNDNKRTGRLAVGEYYAEKS
jgi:ABC-type uncharacterized transport system ATPase component